MIIDYGRLSDYEKVFDGNRVKRRNRDHRKIMIPLTKCPISIVFKAEIPIYSDTVYLK